MNERLEEFCWKNQFPLVQPTILLSRIFLLNVISQHAVLDRILKMKPHNVCMTHIKYILSATKLGDCFRKYVWRILKHNSAHTNCALSNEHFVPPCNFQSEYDEVDNPVERLPFLLFQIGLKAAFIALYAGVFSQLRNLCPNNSPFSEKFTRNRSNLK